MSILFTPGTRSAKDSNQFCLGTVVRDATQSHATPLLLIFDKRYYENIEQVNTLGMITAYIQHLSNAGAHDEPHHHLISNYLQ